MGSSPSRSRSDAPPASVGTDAHQLTDVVTRLRRALRASIRTEYSWERLPMAQIEMLQLLADRAPMRISDIATRQRLAASTVSGLIGQLMASGLVQRTVDPRDRRASAVTLAEAGREQLEAWQHAHETRIQHALDALPAEDRRRVQAAIPALDRLADALDDTDA